jgi:hypothetical protein
MNSVGSSNSSLDERMLSEEDSGKRVRTESNSDGGRFNQLMERSEDIFKEVFSVYNINQSDLSALVEQGCSL